MTSLNVEILNNNKPLKEFKEPVDFTKKSLNEYVNVLQSMQKNVNSALTEIVEQEKLNQSVTGCICNKTHIFINTHLLLVLALVFREKDPCRSKYNNL